MQDTFGKYLPERAVGFNMELIRENGVHLKIVNQKG